MRLRFAQGAAQESCPGHVPTPRKSSSRQQPGGRLGVGKAKRCCVQRGEVLKEMIPTEGPGG